MSSNTAPAELSVPINTDQLRSVKSGATRSIVKLASDHLDSKLLDNRGKEIQFEQITAVCKAGSIECKPRVFRSTQTINGQPRAVVVFRAKRHAGQ